MQRTNHYVESIGGILICYLEGLCNLLGWIGLLFFDEFQSLMHLILYQNERLHGMMQCQIMLVHLWQDCAYIEVDLAGITQNKRLLYSQIFVFFNRREIQTIILDFKSLLQILKRIPQLIGFPEQARKVIVGYGFDRRVYVFTVDLRLLEQFLTHLVILGAEVRHC